jgi:hypothetical protein
MFYLILSGLISNFAVADISHGPITVHVVRVKDGIETPFTNVNVTLALQYMKRQKVRRDDVSDDLKPGQSENDIIIYDFEKEAIVLHGVTDANGLYVFSGFESPSLRLPHLSVWNDFLNNPKEENTWCRRGASGEKFAFPAPGLFPTLQAPDGRTFATDGKEKSVNSFPNEIKFVCPETTH